MFLRRMFSLDEMSFVRAHGRSSLLLPSNVGATGEVSFVDCNCTCLGRFNA